jgi:8-amino-7-oxononanoate synthase
MPNPYDWLTKSLKIIEQADWYRQVQVTESQQAPYLNIEQQPLINFGSNDYLGLAQDKRLKRAAQEAIENYGTGSTGSRLVTGHRQIHRDLEEKLAKFKGSQDSLVFSSGYLANLGTIASLVNSRDLVLSDQYNHSSLKNGAKLSLAKVLEYPHSDCSSLRAILNDQRDKYRRCLIVSDGVFSMDGDLCNLPQLIDLSAEFDSMLLIDDAHATGVVGKKGAGTMEYWGMQQVEFIQVGTLSKALGGLGGYVCGSRELIDYLRNRAATWIYTTGLSPADTAAALEALKILETEPSLLLTLQQNVAYLQEKLNIKKYSPIFPIVVQNPSQAIELAKKLKENGIYVPAIRPPTVPTSRLRVSLMASHQFEHIDKLHEVLTQAKIF